MQLATRHGPSAPASLPLPRSLFSSSRAILVSFISPLVSPSSIVLCPLSCIPDLFRHINLSSPPPISHSLCLTMRCSPPPTCRSRSFVSRVAHHRAGCISSTHESLGSLPHHHRLLFSSLLPSLLLTPRHSIPSRLRQLIHSQPYYVLLSFSRARCQVRAIVAVILIPSPPPLSSSSSVRQFIIFASKA